MKKLWTQILIWFGWTYAETDPSAVPYVQHSVMIMAPHTSIYDFLLGAGCIFKLKMNARVFVKKEFFNWFTRRFLTYCGAVPVDRSNAMAGHGLVEQAVHYFNTEEHFTLVIAPEGTRKPVKRWKRGFYEIAMEAHVPIIFTYVDYKTRRLGLGPVFWPTGDFDADMPKIMEFYKDKTPRHPERYNPYYNVNPKTKS
jgi:1-acyl-sn-glycerol-3-phosphate acyltransferase